jgi:hypothetical protein
VTPLWTPKTEQDIVEGIQSGVLRESHYVEVKVQARNEQVAQTLASFAIDGGVFIIGIAEKKGDNGAKYLVPAPFELEGWLERIDGIARNSIEPPLPIRAVPVPSVADPNTGYIVISVAASPLAPHMADGKYYGRGDASKHFLSDPEVLRHHERRQRQADLGKQLLDEIEANDYLAPTERECGHIYLIAEPHMPVREDLKDNFLEDEAAVRALVRSAGDKCRENLVEWYPAPSLAQNFQHRDSGAALVSHAASGPGRSINPEDSDESGLLEIQLTESGGIRILIGRGTVMVGNTDEKAVFDGLVVAYAQRLVYWVAQLSEKYEYTSTWTVGLRMNGIRGLRSYVGVDDWRHFRPTGSMDRDAYSATRTVSSNSVIEDPDSIVTSLVGRLLRVLGTTASYGMTEVQS